MKTRVSLLLFLLVILVGVRLAAKNWGYGADLSAYKDAVVAVAGGINPYVAHTHMNFVYPPSFLFLGGWMSRLSDRTLGGLWQVVLVASLIGSVWYWTRNLWLMLLSLLFFPVGFALGMGQVSLLLLGLFTLVGYSQSQKYPTLEGILIGLAAAIKLTPLVWLVVALYEKRYIAVVVGLLTFVVLNLVAIVWFGDAGLWWGFVEVMKASAVNQSVYYFNQGLPALLYRLDLGSFVAPVTVLIWGWCWWMMGKLKQTPERLALVAAVATLSASISWQHHLVMYLPLLWLMFFKVREKKSLGWWLWWWAVVILLGMNLKHPGDFSMTGFWYNHAAVGGVLLLALVYWGYKKHPRG